VYLASLPIAFKFFTIFIQIQQIVAKKKARKYSTVFHWDIISRLPNV
jgi:hypothetical protein